MQGKEGLRCKPIWRGWIKDGRSDAEDMSTLRKSLRRREMALQKRSDETESEEEGEEVNQLVDEDEQENQDEPMEEVEQEKRRMSSPCTKSTTMLSSPWTFGDQVPT
ncbi:unnamed protein product [Microthlaspi erraticum]|uniref:Uncharacterized protein n=1 Tax=Microthlaspi erraticum TaxID=1685480 RepID=A0A6D2JNF7_9BRAS|nr:unnamed protein product [Microthlaspi erraticum]